MIRTQIQIPDKLYNQVKEIAESEEWSLAETIRRAMEEYIRRFPEDRPRQTTWTLPGPFNLGLKDEKILEDLRYEQEFRHPYGSSGFHEE